MRRQSFMAALACLASLGIAAPQTRIDLRSQGKSPDFSSMGPTKPAQTGVALPAQCSTGEFFVLTGAAGGLAALNLCVSQNSWAEVGSGTLTVQVDGSSGSTVNTLSFQSSSGTTVTLAGNAGNLSLTDAVDTSVIATRAGIQSGSDSYCATKSGSGTAYLCSEPHPLSAYVDGMTVVWSPDVSCAGGVPATLDIDGNGPRRILENDGLTDPVQARCIAGSQVLLAYSGGLNGGAGGWRIMSGAGAITAPIQHLIAYSFNGGGVPLSAGSTVYVPDIPFSCSVTGWALAVDQGTATVDVWVAPDGSYLPTGSNSITGSSPPAITLGTRTRSANVSGWRTILTSNSSMAITLAAVSGATQASFEMECDQ